MTVRREELEKYLKNWGSNPPQLMSPLVNSLPNSKLALALLAIGAPNAELSNFLGGSAMFSANIVSFRRKMALIKAIRKIKRQADEYLSLLDS